MLCHSLSASTSVDLGKPATTKRGIELGSETSSLTTIPVCQFSVPGSELALYLLGPPSAEQIPGGCASISLSQVQVFPDETETLGATAGFGALAWCGWSFW